MFFYSVSPTATNKKSLSELHQLSHPREESRKQMGMERGSSDFQDFAYMRAEGAGFLKFKYTIGSSI